MENLCAFLTTSSKGLLYTIKFIDLTKQVAYSIIIINSLLYLYMFSQEQRDYSGKDLIANEKKHLTLSTLVISVLLLVASACASLNKSLYE